MGRVYNKSHRPPGAGTPGEHEVLDAVRALIAAPPHVVHNGKTHMTLPGPNATDVCRAVDRYGEYVRPVLMRLVARGVLAEVICGASRCYVLPSRQEVAS